MIINNNAAMNNNPYGNSTASFAAQHGLSTNLHGRVYQNGRGLTREEKVWIGAQYINASDAIGGARPNITHLAQQCGVARSTILGIEEELLTHQCVLDPNYIRANGNIPSGPGSKSMTDVDMFIILALYYEEPSRSLPSYVLNLYNTTGTLVHESTISRFFTEGFMIKGSLCKANHVPLDKFRPENLERAIEYLVAISLHDRTQIKFGDEKHLKGAELFCRRTRRNVFTGVVPPILTSSDFRNTYSIVGFCGIDTQMSAVRYGITEGCNNADNFAMQVQLAIQSGFLVPGNVLVLDRASVHTGGQNTILEDWLWDNFRIFLLLLPARTPEWNPIELVWNILVQRLQVFSLELARQMVGHSLVQASMMILDTITHAEVDGCFRKSGV